MWSNVLRYIRNMTRLPKKQINRNRQGEDIDIPLLSFGRSCDPWPWRPAWRVKVKVHGPEGKWSVQLGESGRSKAPKVDGLGLKWTVQNDIKWTVYESGRSEKRKWTIHKKWNWTALKHAWVVKKGWKWTVLESAWVWENMKVDGLRLRGRSKRDESGRSSKVRG